MSTPYIHILLASALFAASGTQTFAQVGFGPLTDSLGDESFAPVRLQSDPFLPTPATAVHFGGLAYVAGATPGTGHELFRVDPASGEVSLVADVHPGTAGSGAYDLTVVGEWLYFVADDGTHGYELWRTDGVDTELAADLRPGPEDGLATDAGLGNVQPAVIGVVDERLYLRTLSASSPFDVLQVFDPATDEVELYGDVTSAEQVFAHDGKRFAIDEFDRVVRLDEGGASERLTGNFSPAGEYVSIGERLLIDDANDVIFYDPTANRFDTVYAASVISSGVPRLRLEREGDLYFFSDHDTLGTELWRTDGTIAGTECLDLATGEADAPLHDPVVWRGRIVGHDADFAGTRIHAFDPATGEVAPIDELFIDQYSRLAVFDDALFFLTNGDVLYRKDALDAPAVPVTASTIGSERIADWYPLGDLLLVYDEGAAGDRPWFSYGLECEGQRSTADVITCAGEPAMVDGRAVEAPTVVTRVGEQRARGCDSVHVTYVRAADPAGELVLTAPDTVTGENTFAIHSENGEVTWSNGTVGDSLVVDPSAFGGVAGGYVFSATQPSPDGCALQAQVTVYYDVVVSTRDRGAGRSDVLAFPNPTTGAISVRGVGPEARASVYDATGRLVAASPAARVDLTGQPSGLYLLVVEDAGEASRLLVQRR